MVTTQTIATVFDATGDSDTIATQTVKFRSGGNTHIYHFYVAPTSRDVGFVKSTDGGATYGTFQTINSAVDFRHVSVWYDKWTPSDTGDIIHVIATEDTNDTTRYFSIDTASADAVGGDTTIVTFTDNGAATAGCPTITKATNGDLFGASIGITPAGVLVGKSTNAGVSFTDVTGGGATDFNEALDQIQLMPLETDDDVILIGVRTTETDIRSVVYDNSVTDAFEGSSVLIDTGAVPTAGLGHNFGCTIDKSSATIYLMYVNGPVSISDSDLLFRSYPDSTRTWSSSTAVIHPFTTGLVNVIRGDKMAPSMARDQTDGVIMASCLVGPATGNKIPQIFFSTDDGTTWSDMFAIPTVDNVDWRKTQQSMCVLDQLEGWDVSIFREDTDELEGLLATIPIEFVSGVNYDADGTTPETGATITLEETTQRFHVNDTIGGRRPFMGAQLPDGSGNYKNLVFPKFGDEAAPASPDYQGTSYDDNGGAGDEMDLGREVQED